MKKRKKVFLGAILALALFSLYNANGILIETVSAEDPGGKYMCYSLCKDIEGETFLRCGPIQGGTLFCSEEDGLGKEEKVECIKTTVLPPQ